MRHESNDWKNWEAAATALPRYPDQDCLAKPYQNTERWLELDAGYPRMGSLHLEQTPAEPDLFVFHGWLVRDAHSRGSKGYCAR